MQPKNLITISMNMNMNIATTISDCQQRIQQRRLTQANGSTLKSGSKFYIHK